MSDVCGDGICYHYGASELKIAVNGEPGASSRELGDVIRGNFDVVGLSTDPTVD